MPITPSPHKMCVQIRKSFKFISVANVSISSRFRWAGAVMRVSKDSMGVGGCYEIAGQRYMIMLRNHCFNQLNVIPNFALRTDRQTDLRT